MVALVVLAAVRHAEGRRLPGRTALTIPVITVASIWLDGPLLPGLGATQMVLLALTVVLGALTVVPGRATRVHGVVRLVLLGAFLFLADTP